MMSLEQHSLFSGCVGSVIPQWGFLGLLPVFLFAASSGFCRSVAGYETRGGRVGFAEPKDNFIGVFVGVLLDVGGLQQATCSKLLLKQILSYPHAEVLIEHAGGILPANTCNARVDIWISFGERRP